MSPTSRTGRSRHVAFRGARRSGIALGAALMLALILAPSVSASAAPAAGSAVRSIEIPGPIDLGTGGDSGATPPDGGTGSTPPSDPAVDPEPTTDTPSTTPSESSPSTGGETETPASGGGSSSGSGSSTPSRSTGSRAGSGSSSSDSTPVDSPAVTAPTAGMPSAPPPSPSPSPSPSETAGALLPEVSLSGSLGAEATSSRGFGGVDLGIVVGLLAAALLAGLAVVVIRRRVQRDPAAAGAVAWSSAPETAVFSSPLPVSDFPALASWTLTDRASAPGEAVLSDFAGAVDSSPGPYRRAEPPGFFTEGPLSDEPNRV